MVQWWLAALRRWLLYSAPLPPSVARIMENKQAYSSSHATARSAHWQSHKMSRHGRTLLYGVPWEDRALQILPVRLIGPDPSDGIGRHAPSYEHLFLSISATTGTMTVTHLDLNHRTSST